MRHSDSENGFSLLELTVALGVLTVVMGAAVMLLNNFQNASRASEIYAEAERNGRFAVSRLNEIIRSAGCNPTSLTSVNTAAFLNFPNGNGSSSVRLLSDLDGDGLFVSSVSSSTDVIVTSEDVTLQLTGNSLQLIDNTPPPVGVTRSPVTIADDVKSITFTDPDGTAHSVVVDLVAMPTGIRAGDANYIEIEFKSTIRLRNR
jgi:prepilin-type N-terminal cleavage/methylation domain-containing protein